MTAPADLIDCAELREMVDTAAMALAQWAYRDTTKVPGVRDAANVAVECIDAALRELYRIRGELVGQIRRYDDATAARVDALLAASRADRARADALLARIGAERGQPVEGSIPPSIDTHERAGGQR